MKFMSGIMTALHSLTFHHQNHEVSHWTIIGYILVFSLECLIIKHKLTKIGIFICVKSSRNNEFSFLVLGFFPQLFETPQRA